MRDEADIPETAVAPHAARLLREIAETRKIRRFPQARIAELQQAIEFARRKAG